MKISCRRNMGNGGAMSEVTIALLRTLKFINS